MFPPQGGTGEAGEGGDLEPTRRGSAQVVNGRSPTATRPIPVVVCEVSTELSHGGPGSRVTRPETSHSLRLSAPQEVDSSLAGWL